MLHLAKCTVKQASTRKVSETVTILEEGVALVRVMEDGVMKVKPSTGEEGEIFLGFSQNRYTAGQYAPIVEEFTIPGSAPYTLQLSKTPYEVVANSAFYIDGVIATKITTGVPTTGQVLVASTGALTFAAADAGKVVSAVYRYVLTQTEAAYLFGYDLVPFTRQSFVQTSTIEVGEVFTDHYVASDDWASATHAYLGEDGKLTTDDTTGTLVGTVSATPAAGAGFLGVDISI